MKFISLLDGIKQDWTIDEKAKYIYTNLARKITYDSRFLYSHDQELLWSIYNRKIDITEDIDDTRLICNSACKVYLQLLKSTNINAELIYSTAKAQNTIQADDVALVYWNEEGKKRFTNIAADIERCRFGLKTAYFCTDYRGCHRYLDAEDTIPIQAEELREIDKKIGYITRDYTDPFYILLAQETKDTAGFLKFLNDQGIKTEGMTNDDILKSKMMYLTRIIKYRDNAGTNEMMKFYKRLFTTTLNKRDKRKFDAFEFVRYIGNEVEVKSILQIDLMTEIIYYIYIPETQGYEEISKEELLSELEGFHEKKGKKLKIQTVGTETKEAEGPEL